MISTIAKRSFVALIAATMAASALPCFAQKNTKDAKTAPTAKAKIIEFGGPWCVPCVKFAPVFEKIKTSFGNKAEFQSVDVKTDDGEKLSEKYGVAELPTLVVLNSKGKMVATKSGKILMDEKALTAELKQALNK